MRKLVALLAQHRSNSENSLQITKSRSIQSIHHLRWLHQLANQVISSQPLPILIKNAQKRNFRAKYTWKQLVEKLRRTQQKWLSVVEVLNWLLKCFNRYIARHLLWRSCDAKTLDKLPFSPYPPTHSKVTHTKKWRGERRWHTRRERWKFLVFNLLYISRLGDWQVHGMYLNSLAHK